MRPHTMSKRMLHIETTCKIEASLFRARITRTTTATSAARATRCARPMRAPPDRCRPRGSMRSYTCHYQAMSLRSYSGPQIELNAALATSAEAAAAATGRSLPVAPPFARAMQVVDHPQPATHARDRG